MESKHYFDRCPLCGFSKYKEVFLYNSFRYVRCPGCLLIWMNPQLKSKMEADDYEDVDWPAYQRFIVDFRSRQFERDIALIKKFWPYGGHLLDVGTGTGEFLEIASKHGFIALGIEPSKRASERALKMSQVLQGEFETLSLPENSFEVITLWSVLEHVFQPVDFLHKAYRLLKKDGLLALRVPLSSSLINYLCIWSYKWSGHKIAWPLRLFYQLDWHSRHTFIFSEISLFLLLRKTGFKPLEMKRENSFDIPTLKYRLSFKSGGWLFEKLLTLFSLAILFLSRLLNKEDELVLVARKI